MHRLFFFLTLAIGALVVRADAAELITNVSANQIAVPATQQVSMDGGMANAISKSLRDAEAIQGSTVDRLLSEYRVVATRTKDGIVVSIIPQPSPGKRAPGCKGVSCTGVDYLFTNSGRTIIHRHLWF